MAPVGASDEKFNEWLVSECQEAGRKITSLMELDERVVTIGATLLVGAATVAVAQGNEDLLLGLPLAFGALICFIAYLHGEVFALGGYKAALEEHLAKRLGQRLIVWESIVAPEVRHRAASNWIGVGVIAGLYVGASIVALIQAIREGDIAGWRAQHGGWIIAATVAGIMGAGLTAALAFRSAQSSYARAKKATADALDQPAANRRRP
jgi:hypothetical protein